MKYYGICYDGYRWSLVSPKGYESPQEAEKEIKGIMGWSDDQRPINVIHQMWISLLEEWPTPQEQEESRVHSLSLKSQEIFPQPYK